MRNWDLSAGLSDARFAALGKRVTLVSRSGPDVVLHAMRVSVWGRWFIWFVGIVMLVRRPDLWYPDDIWYVHFNVLLAATNGFLHYRLLTNKPVTWRWMLVMSAVDIMLITAHIVVSGRFDNLFFVVYYPSLAMFAVVFSSLWVILAWVTGTAIVYFMAVVVAGPGVDIELGQDHVLAARLTVMYLIPLGVSLIVRFERTRWQVAVSKERQMRRERIDLSQKIHDTTAQSAYLIDLGIHRARKLADSSNVALVDALKATSEISRSTIWQIRGPIDEGHIVEGRELGRVLWSHCQSFETISGIPTKVAQSGVEPPLAREIRSGLFSIAHNALTNAFLHARASKVDVKLDCGEARSGFPYRTTASAYLMTMPSGAEASTG